MADLSDKFEGKYQLFTYQDISADELVAHTRYALWHEVGCGKTLTAVAALNRLPEGSVLILAPKRVIDGVWKHLDVPIKHENVLLLNYEKLSRMDTYPTADYVVLDESQKIKSGTTKIAKQIKAICKTAKYCWCLSGTPVGNSFVDVFNIFKNIGIKEFQYPESAFIAKYYETYNIPVQTRFGQKNIPCIKSLRSQFEEELMEMFGKYSNSIKMADVHTLPDKHEHIVEIEDMDTDEYKLAEQGIIAVGGDEFDVVAKLEAVNKAHQLANGFMYFKPTDSDKKVSYRRLQSENYKLKELLRIVSTYPTDNIVIVYKFKADCDILYTELTKIGRTPVMDFEDIDLGDVLLIQVGAAEGINLQTWSHIMMFYSYDYSHLAYTQAEGRIYRVGQLKECHYYIFISRHTVEEKIYNAIMNKHSLDTFLKDVTKLDMEV